MAFSPSWWENKVLAAVLNLSDCKLFSASEAFLCRKVAGLKSTRTRRCPPCSQVLGLPCGDQWGRWSGDTQPQKACTSARAGLRECSLARPLPLFSTANSWEPLFRTTTVTVTPQSVAPEAASASPGSLPEIECQTLPQND